MSKNSNVNPGHYKVAGRDRQGEAIVQAEHKATYATQKAPAPTPPEAAARNSGGDEGSGAEDEHSRDA